MTVLLAASLPLFTTEPDVASMTVEEKVGQTLMVHVTGQEANEDAKTLIQDLGVGGIIYYTWANGMTSPGQVQKLSNGLQELAAKNNVAIPLFIAADQEGGVVNRLNKGFTIFPGNRAVGVANDIVLAKLIGLYSGQEARAVGVNTILAPVVDIATSKDSYIGIRSYGSSPELVTHLAKAQMDGYNEANIIACMKHFPGHGDVVVDSHEALPFINKTEKQLQQCELVPYYRLAKKCDAIMSAHIMVPALDAHNCATLSPTIMTTLLRKEIGFDGVVFSDSLVMQGVLNNCSSVEDAAIKAFNAGSDVLILGGKQLTEGGSKLELTVADIKRIFKCMVAAVKDGRISEQKLNESTRRILQLKAKRGLFTQILPEQKDTDTFVATKEHKEAAIKVAALSVKMISNKLQTPYDLKSKKIVVVAPKLMQDVIEDTQLKGYNTTFRYVDAAKLSLDEKATLLEECKNVDVVIAASYNAWKNEPQKAFLQEVIQGSKQSVVVAVRDPQDAELFPQATTVITTVSPTSFSIEAAINLLK